MSCPQGVRLMSNPNASRRLHVLLIESDPDVRVVMAAF
jgi:hypothetical protein